MKQLIYLTATWLFSFLIAFPVAAQWTPLPNQPTRKVAKYKDSRYNWIVVENADRVMFSANAGQSWQDISEGLPEGFQLENVIIREAHIFGVEQTSNTVFRFDFINNKWLPSDDGLPESGFYGSLTELGSNMVLIYQNTTSGVSSMYISKDNGQSWHPMESISQDGFKPRSIDYLEESGVAVAIGTLKDANVVYTSDNDGESWVQAEGLENACEVGYTISDGKDLVLAMTNCGQLYLSPHAGLNWVLADKLPDNIRPKAVATAGISTFLLADYPEDEVSRTSLFRSKDGGENWEKTKITLSLSDESSSLVSSGNNLLLIRNNTVLTSVSGGKSWSYAEGLEEVGFLRNARIYDNGFRLFLSGDGGVFTSSDDGLTWEPADGDLEETLIKLDQLAIMDGKLTASFPFAGNLLMYDSENETWTSGRGYGKVRQLTSSNSFFNSANTNAVIYSVNAVFGKTTFQYSVDGGETFSVKNSNIPTGRTFYSIAAFGNRVFCGYNGGVMRSTDAGNTWITLGNYGIPTYAAITALAHDPANRTIYASGPYTGVFKFVKDQFMPVQISEATGASDLMKKGSHLFAFDGLHLIRIDLTAKEETVIEHPYMIQKFHSTADRLLFVRGNLLIATPKGVIRSGNMGDVLVDFSEGLPLLADELLTITSLANDSKYLYAAVEGHGIYRRKVNDLPVKPFGISDHIVSGDPQLKVKLYPNPATDFVQVDFAEADQMPVGELQLVNSLGQVIASEKVSPDARQQFRFALDNQSKGLYQIRLISQDGITLKPFLKVK
ncbi:MAG: hypothetical protein CMN32_04995 [Saprospirales bacterium]|nr:hypothetical protein [Saprospirales bacterium]